ncbi:MAG: PIN domain-containing protein [Acidimicrobiia bacterium]|nr:PIN domain-containing protein [Acidimicrobiia bacterium]MYA38508.1 PIN domain-containing protein [Acidimicrobiia bacterium]MYB79716.1 PIN domain-containing protein [Acidimicrobiia bacterium]MYD41294.1 PIN domain-containing protein [Acidimicrobiia bacterium]MYH05634.1 PIN domain-containing protein [Acidimicrobiia bacterium]
MIAVDTNLLVYAHRREARHHREAASIMRGLAEGNDVWAVPWPCCYEFLSVVTNPRIWKESATSPEQAWRQLSAWTGSPSMRLIGETKDFQGILERFVRRPRVIGGVVHDARIAAICVAHGAELLLTRDRDFSLFPELKTRDPIGRQRGVS